MNSLHSTEVASPAHAVAESMYAFGFDMTTQERWRDASDVFRAMLLVCPSDERSWLGLGRCHGELGQTDLAIELYSLCICALPRAVRTRVALATLLREIRRDDDAERVLEAAEQVAQEMDDEELVLLVDRARRAS